MCILRSLHARRMFLCLGLLGALVLSAGCGDENPVKEGSTGPPPGAMTAEREKEARQKAFGASGVPGKTATPKK